MAELLIYVNENPTCSVFIEKAENMMLDKFRREILDEQVDDLLDFPFKFTWLISNKSVAEEARAFRETGEVYTGRIEWKGTIFG